MVNLTLQLGVLIDIQHTGFNVRLREGEMGDQLCPAIGVCDCSMEEGGKEAHSSDRSNSRRGSCRPSGLLT